MKQLILICFLFTILAFSRNHVLRPMELKADTIVKRENIHTWMHVDMPDSVLVRWKKDSFGIHGLTFYVIHDTAWRSPNMPK